MKKLTIEYCINMFRELTTIRSDKIDEIEKLIAGTKLEISGITYKLSADCMFINESGVYIWITDEYSKSIIEIIENPGYFCDLLQDKVIWNAFNCLHQLDEIINVYESKIQNTYNYFDTYHPRNGSKVIVYGLYFESNGSLQMFGSFHPEKELVEFFLDHRQLQYTGGIYEY